MKKLYVVWGFVIVVIIAGLFVISQSNDNSVSERKIKIGLNPWIGNGIYYVAQEKGFFTQEGLEVEFVHYDDGAIGKQLLLNGEINVLDLTPETAVVLADTGAKVKVIATLDTSEGADGIIAAQEIKTLADLKGKKVAFENGSPSHLLLSYLLDQEGLTTKDLIEVNMPAPDAGAAFVSGQVDAAVTWEPWLSQAVDRPGGKILASSKTAPILPNLIIVQAGELENNPEALKAMLRALFNTEHFIQSNKQESYEIMAKNFSITLEEVESQVTTFRWLSYQNNLDGLTEGEFSPYNTINKAATLWYKLGLVRNEISAEDIVDNSLLKDLYQ